MSLDVYLDMPEQFVVQPKIFIREYGFVCEVSREEWDKRYPGREPFVTPAHETTRVFEANITHNLNTMAGEAGIYGHLWKPELLGITSAAQLVEPLEAGLSLLRAEPERFKAYNPSNGYGNYEGLVRFVESYLAACRQYPTATVSVSR